MTKLSIIWRGFGGELDSEDFKPFRPSFYNKFKCFKSTYDAFSNCDFYVVWDGPTDNELYKYICKFPVYLLENQNPGNINSLLTCYDLAARTNTDLIYFSEDDYLHKHNSYKVLWDLFKFSHVVSLCDYADRYNNIALGDLNYGHEFIFKSQNCFARTASSTTMTFGCSKEFFNNYKDLLIEFTKGENGAPEDRKMWHELIKKGSRLVTPVGEYSQSAHMVINTLPGLTGLEEKDWKEFNDSVCL